MFKSCYGWELKKNPTWIHIAQVPWIDSMRQEVSVLSWKVQSHGSKSEGRGRLHEGWGENTRWFIPEQVLLQEETQPVIWWHVGCLWPTPVFLPGESQGQRSLVGCRLWGSHRVGQDWSNLAAAAGCLWTDDIETLCLEIVHDGGMEKGFAFWCSAISCPSLARAPPRELISLCFCVASPASFRSHCRNMVPYPNHGGSSESGCHGSSQRPQVAEPSCLLEPIMAKAGVVMATYENLRWHTGVWYSEAVLKKNIYICVCVFVYIYIYIYIYIFFFSLKEIRLISKMCVLSLIRFFVTPWTVARQVLLSMGFSRQEYCSG